jgi:hypothetical protein
VLGKASVGSRSIAGDGNQRSRKSENHLGLITDLLIIGYFRTPIAPAPPLTQRLLTPGFRLPAPLLVLLFFANRMNL